MCTLEILGWSDVFDALVGCFSLFGSAVLVWCFGNHFSSWTGALTERSESVFKRFVFIRQPPTINLITVWTHTHSKPFEMSLHTADWCDEMLTRMLGRLFYDRTSIATSSSSSSGCWSCVAVRQTRPLYDAVCKRTVCPIVAVSLSTFDFTVSVNTAKFTLLTLVSSFKAVKCPQFQRQSQPTTSAHLSPPLYWIARPHRKCLHHYKMPLSC